MLRAARPAFLAMLLLAGLVRASFAQEYGGSSAYGLAPLEDQLGWRDRNWNAEATMIFLRRENSEPLLLVNGDTPIVAADLDFDFRIGPRVSLIRNGLFNSNWDLEGTYFGVPYSNAQAASNNATTFFTTPNIALPAPATVRTHYRSDLHSSEVNLRHRTWDWATLLAGFRWIEMRDELFTDLSAGASHRVNVNNHLYGVQIGADGWVYSVGKFDINAWGKVGLYGNWADQTTTVVGVPGVVASVSARDCQAAFVGELGVAALYRLREWLGVRAGYQVLLLDALAFAPPQIPASNLGTGAAVLDVSDTPVYHGGYLGFEMNW